MKRLFFCPVYGDRIFAFFRCVDGAFLAAGALLLVSVQACAPEPSKDLSSVSLEDLMSIQVTSASKKEQKMKLSQVAAAIFVITQGDIHKYQNNDRLGRTCRNPNDPRPGNGHKPAHSDRRPHRPCHEGDQELCLTSGMDAHFSPNLGRTAHQDSGPAAGLPGSWASPLILITSLDTPLPECC
jgi:hypothetical protein